MSFQSFEEALQICLTAPNGSKEQDAALVFCMEHAPDDLNEMLKQRFLEFHTGKSEADHEHDENCGCSGHQPQKPRLTDFIK